MMALSRPFTDALNLPLMFAGAVVALAGVFLKKRPSGYQLAGIVSVMCVLFLFAFAKIQVTILVFVLTLLVVGPVGILRPDWLIHGVKNPERLERDRRWWRVTGYKAIFMSVITLVVLYLTRHDGHTN